MESWTVKPLNPGDHIRISRGSYYHHGIYLGNGEVAHYCGPEGDDVFAPENVEVRITPMSRFTDGFCEVKEYYDKRKRRSPKEIVNYAKSKEGTKGYDPLNNNCEHFANECVYGEGFSQFVDDTRSRIRELLGKKK